MQRHQIITIVFLSTLIMLSCGRPSIPEFYGLYARDGSHLIDLQGANPEAWNLSPNVEFILFHKDVSNPLFVPEKHFRLLYMRYVRSSMKLSISQNEIGSIHSLDELRAIGTYMSNQRVDRWQQATRPIGRYAPIGESPDMIALSTDRPLNPGTYEIRRTGGQSTWVYRVGIETTEEGSEQHGCVDQQVYEVQTFGGPLATSTKTWIEAMRRQALMSRGDTKQPSVAAILYRPCSEAAVHAEHVLKRVDERLANLPPLTPSSLSYSLNDLDVAARLTLDVSALLPEPSSQIETIVDRSLELASYALSINQSVTAHQSVMIALNCDPGNDEAQQLLDEIGRVSSF